LRGDLYNAGRGGVGLVIIEEGRGTQSAVREMKLLITTQGKGKIDDLSKTIEVKR